MDAATMRQHLAEARVGHLATASATAQPHIVPCCFALSDGTLYSAVDAKPKTTTALRRLANLRQNTQASLLVDHYDEDWTALWWIRVDGSGRVVDAAPERDHALVLLTAKYEQYRSNPPQGPVLAVDIDTWRSWP